MSAEYQRQWRAKKAREAGREPGRPGRPATQPHGTTAAYKRHQRHGEEPCLPCRDAWAAYQRELYQRRKLHVPTQDGRSYEPIGEGELPEGLRWDVPGRNQGQTVEVAYADPSPLPDPAGPGSPYRRVLDRSDNSVTYERLV